MRRKRIPVDSLLALRQRRLHVPRELAVPPCLQGVVDRDVSLKQIRAGWDGLVHVASSIEGGWTSAVLALERLGSAVRADATYKAGAALGKLLLSLFLCDYLSNPAFRRDILRLLNRGESVHALRAARSMMVGWRLPMAAARMSSWLSRARSRC